MDTITLDELDMLLDNHFVDGIKRPLFVFLNAEGCHPCDMFYSEVTNHPRFKALEAIAEVRIINVTGRPPMFTPPVYPSIIGFTQGVRFWEWLGNVEEVGTFFNAAMEWAKAPHARKLSLSSVPGSL